LWSRQLAKVRARCGLVLAARSATVAEQERFLNPATKTPCRLWAGWPRPLRARNHRDGRGASLRRRAGLQ